MHEFTEPETEFKKLKIHVAMSIGLTISILLLSLPHMLPAQFSQFLPMSLAHNSSYIMLLLATPYNFGLAGDSIRVFGMELKQKLQTWIRL